MGNPGQGVLAWLVPELALPNALFSNCEIFLLQVQPALPSPDENYLTGPPNHPNAISMDRSETAAATAAAASAEATERYNMLLQACEQAISVIAQEFEQTDLQKFFPHLADNPSLVTRSAQQSSNYWAQNANQAVFNEIDRQQVHSKLDLLLQLEQEARNRRSRLQSGSTDPRDQPVDMTGLTPKELTELRLQPQKLAYLTALRARMAAAQTQRADLDAEADAKLVRLAALLKSLS